jgi:cellulose synthase/poly-beta-1,6-N-acetylglucosamine synthase-like glycosyltransferase
MRVWVLDDGQRPWLEALCASKGAHYLTRPDNHHAKAGNINHALDFLRDQPDPPEFVAIFDADFVPHGQFLWRTIPLFHDPSVGLVQTPQHFFNRDWPLRGTDWTRNFRSARSRIPGLQSVAQSCDRKRHRAGLRREPRPTRN